MGTGKAHLKPLQLLFGICIQHPGGIWAGGRPLSRLEPVLEAGIVIQKLLPQPPGLLDPEEWRTG